MQSLEAKYSEGKGCRKRHEYHRIRLLEVSSLGQGSQSKLTSVQREEPHISNIPAAVWLPVVFYVRGTVILLS